MTFPYTAPALTAAHGAGPTRRPWLVGHTRWIRACSRQKHEQALMSPVQEEVFLEWVIGCLILWLTVRSLDRLW